MSYKFLSFEIASTLLSVLILISCGPSPWEDAKQTDTYKAYQSYIDEHPSGKYVDTAQNRADSLYWVSIKNDTTAKAFGTYLQKFPNGRYRSKAQKKDHKLSKKPLASSGVVTGSGIIIRSDHSTDASSKGVIAKEGTEVEILERYKGANRSDAILKHNITALIHGQRIELANGKAIHIEESRNDSVRASLSTSQFGPAETTISKDDIENMSNDVWYKINTSDEITGWIYGKYLKQR